MAEASDEQKQTVIEDPTLESPEDLRVAELLACGDEEIDLPALAEAVEAQEPADAADTIEALEEEHRGDVLGEMEEEAAAEALSYMQKPLAVGIVEELVEDDISLAGRLLGLMEPDDATDLLQALDDERRERLLALINHESAIKLRKLMTFDEESAGGMMTTDCLILREGMTVSQATESIRATDVAEDATHAFVLDRKGHLTGIIALRRLLIARPNEPVDAIMEREVDAIPPHLDREAVAHEFERYDYQVLPVVDREKRLLGMVTVDDVIDIIRAEHTEDAQRVVGAGAEEGVNSSVAEKLRGRLPWLLVNLFTSAMAAIVVLNFESLIAELAILAVLMPVIANQAGNAGQQSLAVTLRGLVLNEVQVGRVRALLRRETTVGMINGLIGGTVVGGLLAVVGMFGEGPGWRLGVVAGLSMSIALAMGCLVGSSLPILMRRLGFDPATASTIFLTMVTDSASFFVFLGLAQIFAAALLGAA